MQDDKRVAIALLVLRLTVFAAMLMWTVDKFVRPEHASAIFEHFYAIKGVGSAIVHTLAVLELLLLLGFVLGVLRTWTYALVLLLHAGSTLSAWHQYMTPFEGTHLLFFAAWPMLAACLTLFMLREYDTLTVDGRRSRSSA